MTLPPYAPQGCGYVNRAYNGRKRKHPTDSEWKEGNHD